MKSLPPLYGNQVLAWLAYDITKKETIPGAGWGPDIVRSLEAIWANYQPLYERQHGKSTTLFCFEQVMSALVRKGHLERREADGVVWFMAPISADELLAYTG